jgi:putative Mg2+ transporter-C (MgtC) family protein
MIEVPVIDIAVRLTCAVAFGTVVGAERQWRNRLAGLRTNALVGLGAASFTLFAAMTPGDASPTRVAAQVVSGIGFLGAGVIMRDGMKVRGLNSAATLWCVASVGVLCGAGLLYVAAIATTLIVVANVSLRPLVRLIDRLVPSPDELPSRYMIQVATPVDHEAKTRAMVVKSAADHRFRLERLETHEDEEDESYVEIRAHVLGERRDLEQVEGLVAKLNLDPDVSDARWTELHTDPDEEQR